MNAPAAPGDQPVPISLPNPDSARTRLTSRVKYLAACHGLTVSAVTSADPFADTEAYLHQHIDAGRIDGLDWFTHERARFSSDVRNLQPSARSILAVGIAYWPGPTEKPDDGVARGRISRYAWGKDYHRVLKRRMKSLHAALEEDLAQPIEARFLVDTARVVERAVAARAGLGWYGKHACLIVPGFGSWVLLGELLLDIELEPDQPLARDCGRCTICIDRCPTGAIVEPYGIDTPTCISYLTIELRSAIPRDLRPKMGDWVYGCDVCQQVCPYTGAAAIHDDDELRPASVDNAYPSLYWLLGMTNDEFGATYFGTPVPRTKRRGLARNAAVALGNIGNRDDVPILAAVLGTHDEPLVRGHVAWALGQIGGPAARLTLDRARRTEPDPHVVDEIEVSLETPQRSLDIVPPMLPPW